MVTLKYVEGIGDAYAAKLNNAGIGTSEALLEQGKTPAGRKAIAAKSGINESLVLQWVNHVDLFRIKGIGAEYGDLLEAAGVDTVPELAQRKPENLLEKMTTINAEKNIVRRLPVLSQVMAWVEQAKKLPRVITY